ncbi:class I SAM-dependent methyltransferase [Asanoa sp. NPDC049573]|uniref:class I SAM-dependent methyltransferase n=1 Tax=Asanoa sp. NPDC049573 TaxID=3155396 RepID=UPI00343AD9B8
MTVHEPGARVFGDVADEYDRIRPGYPPALVDDVLDYARLGDAPAIEIGAGTGKATVAFAQRGVAITAVEPDEKMAAVLTRRVPDVAVVTSSLEEYRPTRRYGLLYSAQAWHWTDPAGRWERAANALAPGGALALFWNMDRPADPDVTAVVLAAHRRHAPHIVPNFTPSDEAELRTSWPGTELGAHAEFGDLAERLYRWNRPMSAADYVALLATRSDYLLLDRDAHARLFRDVEDSLGDRVDLCVETALYLARRRGSARRD